jgi:hypothetical protein
MTLDRDPMSPIKKKLLSNKRKALPLRPELMIKLK